MEENEKAPYTVDELNGAWHEIVDKYLLDNIMLRKELSRLQIDNEDLKIRLHQVELNLLKAQGKQAIDSTHGTR